MCWRCLRLHHRRKVFLGKTETKSPWMCSALSELGRKKEKKKKKQGGKHSLVILFVIILFFHHPAQQQPLRSATAPPTRPGADAALCEHPPAPPHPCWSLLEQSRWVDRGTHACLRDALLDHPLGRQLGNSAPPPHLPVAPRGEFPGWLPHAQHQQCQDKAGGARSQQTILLAMGWEGKAGPGLPSPCSAAHRGRHAKRAH